jgi:hypothetical protein
MKVKVGNKIYDGNEEPVMVILTDQDKENIKNMHPDCTKYCVYPESWGEQEEVSAWMNGEYEAEEWPWDDEEPERDLSKYHLVCTCGACPEQYDVYEGEKRVAYFRLRHGYFYAACPWVGGEVVYDAYPDGDGCFTADEQEFFLTEALNAVYDYYEEEKEDE